MNAKQKTQAHDLVVMFLQRGEHVILDTDFDGVIVAKENNEVVFITIEARAASDELPEENITQSLRSDMERLAIKYMCAHNLPSCKVRFDICSLLLASDGKAFMRHHRDALCSEVVA